MATVSVTIDGKTYRMACDEGQEEHLTGLAQQLDQYITHLKTNFGEIGDHRLSVMAGIMVMDEMSEIQKQFKTLKDEIEILKRENEALANANNNNQKHLSETVEKVTERIELLAARLGHK